MCWDPFGFRVEDGVWVVMDAFQGGPMQIATVDYPHGLDQGPRTVVKLDFAGNEVDRRLHELCTLRSVRHWASVWHARTVRGRWKRDAHAVMQQMNYGTGVILLVQSFL